MARSRVQGLRLAVLAGLGSALPVACTSYETALSDFDAITRVPPRQSEPEQESFLTNPQELPWVADGNFPLAESSLFQSTADVGGENPSGFARDRMEILADKAAGDLYRTVEVIPRLMAVGQLDRSPLNRIVALRSMSHLMEHLGLPIAGFELPQLSTLSDSEILLATLADLNRQGDTGGPGRTLLLETLEACGRAPLRNPGQRRELIPELVRTLRLARDEEMRDAARTALALSLRHGVHLIFLLNLQDNASPGIEVRRVAIQEIHRLTGPDSMGYLISLTQRPRMRVPAGDPGFDPEPYVLMEMVRLCGQLNRERAMRGYRNGPAPSEFLYDLIRAPIGNRTRGPYRGLRILALEALALSLGEPVSFEPQWAAEWWDRNQEQIRAGVDR